MDQIKRQHISLSISRIVKMGRNTFFTIRNANTKYVSPIWYKQASVNRSKNLTGNFKNHLLAKKIMCGKVFM